MTRLLVLALAVAAVPALAQPASDDELAAIRHPIDLYFRAQATGDGDLIRRAFHPEARVSRVVDGRLVQTTAEEFAGRFDGSPPEDEPARRRRIVSVDVTGDVAVVKVELDYPDVFFTDYITLLRFGDGWRIINKSYHVAPPLGRVE